MTPELPSFDLLHALNHGLIPDHYLSTNIKKSLHSYIQDYLKQEVFDEGLTRNIPAFSRFFDAMGYAHGELTNYSNIARNCGVDSKTVKEYYQILEDTLLGSMIAPFRKRQHRQVISRASKFYLFDVGVAGALTRRILDAEQGPAFGKAFEHFLLMEIRAHNSYKELYHDINFWRTKTGLEVDFILGQGEVAIEIKGTQRVDKKDFTGLRAFVEEYKPREALIVCNEKHVRKLGEIRILPYQHFIHELWAGLIIN